MTINLTINSFFRHPLRWGKCPMNLKREWVFGLFYDRRMSPISFTDIKILSLYFYKWQYTISNYPLI